MRLAPTGQAGAGLLHCWYITLLLYPTELVSAALMILLYHMSLEGDRRSYSSIRPWSTSYYVAHVHFSLKFSVGHDLDMTWFVYCTDSWCHRGTLHRAVPYRARRLSVYGESATCLMELTKRALFRSGALTCIAHACCKVEHNNHTKSQLAASIRRRGPWLPVYSTSSSIIS